MTAKTLLVIAGHPQNHGHEHELLQAADRVAAQHVKRRGGALMTEESKHFETFVSIAAAVYGEAGIEREREALRKLDAVCEQVPGFKAAGHEWPSDAACNVYTPQLSAAYYFGLALGLRLAGEQR